MHNPAPILENDMLKFLWSVDIQTDHLISAIRPNLIIITTSKGSSDALSRPDLHFESAGNGPVVITWIGREHGLYRGASPISLVEHCVTFRHDRRLLSLWEFVHNWPTSRWSATKKKTRFSLNGNGIMSSFLGRHFYRSTLQKAPIVLGICTQLAN